MSLTPSLRQRPRLRLLAARPALVVGVSLLAALTACSKASDTAGGGPSPATTAAAATSDAAASSAPSSPESTAASTAASQAPSSAPATAEQSSSAGPATAGAAPGGDPALAALYAGILKSPDTASRPVAKGKKVVVISSGQASISSAVPSNAALEAGRALGWDMSLYDAQLQPSKGQDLIRQALAANADGIILDATDCNIVKTAMQEAKAKGVAIIGIYSFDCDDPHLNAGPPLATTYINYQGKTTGTAIADFTKAYGAAQADAVIAATKGQGKILFFNQNDLTVLFYTGQGFKDEIKAKCPGCSIVADVSFTGAELGPALQQKVSSALLQHPEANAIKSPYTAAALLGISPALVQSGRQSQIFSMGGEGFAPELDLIRNRQGVDAVEITPSDWTGYAAIDTLNSVFNKSKPVDSGLGYQLVDRTHGLPASGPFIPAVDFKAAYKKAWGVG